MYEPSYFVCVLLEDPPKGVFDKWPLHLTLAPWFEISEDNMYKCFTKIEEDLKRIGFFSIKPTNTDFFGENKDILVTRVNGTTSRLPSLHDLLMETIQNNGGKFMGLKYTGKNYKPHVTVKADGTQLPMHRKAKCTRAAIIERGRPDNEHGVVVRLISLV